MSAEPDVRRLRGDHPVARRLLAAMEAELVPLHPPLPGDDMSLVVPAELAPPAGAYVALAIDGRPVAGGGVRRSQEGVGEVKRMYVEPGSRGRGLGRRLLRELEGVARDLGYRRLRLDTVGSLPRFYESAGYTEIADYNGNPHATYWGEKAL
jgi:GNAT superfamily N-acetyltransferase